MRKYSADQERAIRVAGLVDDWAASGLLDETQWPRLRSDLQVDLRRTNVFLRLTLFGFGLLIIAAAVGFVAVVSGWNDEGVVGALFLIAAAGSAALAETLVSNARLYRFGIEEAAAVCAVALAGFGTALITSTLPSATADPEEFLGLVAGSAAAFAVYRRFGYVYAAVASMLLGALAPFQLGGPQEVHRLLAVAVFGAFFAVSRVKRHKYGDDYPGDEYGLMQAAAWLGMYAFLNLHLTFGVFGFDRSAFSREFYWFTYGLMWILPAVGLWMAIRDRDRPLLDAGLVMALLTLMTNKPYLGRERQTWDPILFGVLLIGVVLVVRRWLAAGADGARHGVTAVRLLSSEREKLAAVGTASAAFQPGPVTQSEPATRETFGGGRSGGAGASGSY